MTISDIEPEALDIANQKLIDSINSLKFSLGTSATNTKSTALLVQQTASTILKTTATITA
ncbi:MAG: hypothetical protein WBE68_22140 [Candidatus Nitrosopolaris sp.]